MASNQIPVMAKLGSLDLEVAHDLKLLRDFIEARERHMRRLFGRNVRRSPTRDEILRIVVLAFSECRFLHVSSCIQLCSGYATAPTVRSELALMAEAGLVLFQADAAENRSAYVIPTEKLVEFYNREIPRLREVFQELMLRAEQLSRSGVSA